MGTKYQGNSRFRVTVGKPNTLQDLQNIAQRQFGHNGPLQLWHHGKDQIHAHHHVNNIQHDDVVVVTWGNMKPPEGFTAITTHKADFVPHALEKPHRPTTPKTPPKVPFHGKTSYNSDFVPHKPSRSGNMRAPPSMWQPSDAPTGKTTYNSHFVKPTPEPLNRPLMPNATTMAPLPFEGQSSYNRDYVKHPFDPNLSFTKQPKDTHVTDAPFEGVTTYAGDFNPKPIRPRSACRPPRPQSQPLPFQGHTEYRQEYVKKRQDRFHIHLEPAHHLTS